MSYRELRNFCEMSRTLGYPRLLSIENFRTPNFKLVAEILEWVVKRFEPNASLSASQTTTEQDRVLFIKQAVLLLLQNSRLKLNPKKLYQADGHAVQELLPAMKLLYSAARTGNEEDVQSQWNSIKSRLGTKMQEARIARQISTQLPNTAASLHELLGKQILFAKQRERAISRSIPLSEAEKAVQQSILAIVAETESITTKLNNVSTDEATLDEKIERKKREYEQMQKRYAKLQHFRPQFLDEYEKYESKLKVLYEQYVLKFRNLSYMQQLQVEIEKAEHAESEKVMRQLVEKIRLEEENAARFRLELGDDHENAPITNERGQSKKVFGNMTGGAVSDEDDEEREELEDPEGTEAEDDDMLIASTAVEEDKAEASSGDDF
ncbi:hypothetical protein WR25_16711 [Diploscapter pachys]|uniref:Clusterin-associated protein 1 n=1 Tax=Diploscapter pachys TaxID=2018661 RepID=A0A2A2LUK1_9BILA|nr:hypothetical protein WR25_16711 [Diploscapter pachys]